MTPGIKFSQFLVFNLVGISAILSQSFEGSITQRAITSDIEQTSTAFINGPKSIREFEVDSTESIKVITNEETGWQILLRHKDDLKYGFKRDSQWKDTLDCEEIDYDNIGMEVQQDEKIICGYNCRKYIFKTEEIISEAWITRDLDFTLSKYFPEFLQKDASFSFYQFRKRVDCEGFVMNYWEKDLISDEELKLEIQVFESEVPDYKFYYDSGYHVLDAEGMRQLYLDSRNDIQKKKLWDEFMQLFGK